MSTNRYCTALFNQVVPNTPPTAVISATPTSGIAPLTVMFDGLGSSDVNGTITGYSWNFGDGTTASGAAASHIYPVGSFTATLSVTDNLNTVGSVSAIINVAQSEGLSIIHSGQLARRGWCPVCRSPIAFWDRGCYL
jgi:PKD repeat protein